MAVEQGTLHSGEFEHKSLVRAPDEFLDDQELNIADLLQPGISHTSRHAQPHLRDYRL